MTHPILELDLLKAGVTTIIWATGYSTDYSWLKVDAFKENGKPQHPVSYTHLTLPTNREV